MKARPYKKLLRLSEAEHSRLLYLSKTTGLNQEQVLRQALMNAPLLERPTADYIKMVPDFGPWQQPKPAGSFGKYQCESGKRRFAGGPENHGADLDLYKRWW